MKSNGFSLTEVLVVIAVVALLAGIFANSARTVFSSWGDTIEVIERNQTARAGLEYMTQEFRQASEITAISTSNLTYINAAEETITIYETTLDSELCVAVDNETTEELEQKLIFPIEELSFIAYDNDLVTQTTNPVSVNYLEISLQLPAPEKAQLYDDYAVHMYFPQGTEIEVSLVINEIMYSPDSGIKRSELPLYEYVELYNMSDSPIDTTGWKLVWNNLGDSRYEDSIVQDTDNQVNNISVEVPANGYALIGVDASKIYDGTVYTIPDDSTAVPDGQVRLAADDRAFGKSELENSGTLYLLDASDIIMDQAVVDSTWLPSTEGTGYSYERTDPADDGTLQSSWEASAAYGGTPGGSN